MKKNTNIQQKLFFLLKILSIKNFIISLAILLSSLMTLQSCSNNETLINDELEQQKLKKTKNEKQTNGKEEERMCTKGKCDDDGG